LTFGDLFCLDFVYIFNVYSSVDWSIAGLETWSCHDKARILNGLEVVVGLNKYLEQKQVGRNSSQVCFLRTAKEN